MSQKMFNDVTTLQQQMRALRAEADEMRARIERLEREAQHYARKPGRKPQESRDAIN